MRKIKILLVLFIVILCFFLVENTNAYTCSYEGENRYVDVPVDPQYGVTGNVDVKSKIEGGATESDNIQNWTNKVHGFDAMAYTVAEKCPEYFIFAWCGDGWTEINEVFFYVSDKANLENVKANSCNGKKPFSGWPKVLKLKAQPQKPNEQLIEKPTSCLEFNKGPNSSAKEGEAAYYSCEQNPYFACVWNELDAKEGKSYCNTDKLQFVTCGDAVDIPPEVPSIISFTVNLLKIVTPLILIFISIISLIKAISSQKEDEIKKAQSSLISKIIISAIIFFVISIVQFVILRVADAAEQKNLSTCLSCFLNNDCAANKYYKTYVANEMRCHLLNGKEINCETGK